MPDERDEQARDGWVLRVEGEWHMILPPPKPEQTPKLMPKPTLVPAAPSMPPIHYTAPPPGPERAPYGVYVEDRWSGVTTLIAIDHDGTRLCEWSIRTDLIRAADIAEMRAFLDERSRASHLSLA